MEQTYRGPHESKHVFKSDPNGDSRHGPKDVVKHFVVIVFAVGNEWTIRCDPNRAATGGIEQYNNAHNPSFF